jgi:hypothetical protein
VELLEASLLEPSRSLVGSTYIRREEYKELEGPVPAAWG